MIIITYPNLFNEKQIKGITCELECASKFIKYGFIVSVPYGNTSRYDFIIDTGNKKYFRIQCKSSCRHSNGGYVINTSNTQFTANSKKIKHYFEDQIDFICSIIEDQLIVIPVSLIENSKSKIFRTHNFPPINNSCYSTCNWIEDYSVEKQILPLL